MKTYNQTRRSFLGCTAAAIATFLSGQARSQKPPQVTSPRATDGDDHSEPDWDECLTITVGPDKADLLGSHDKVIQGAVDYVARLGSGTVHVLPGTYRMRNSAPALIETEMVTSNPNARPDLIPVGRFGRVEETADVAVMLARNGYVTGQTINVNGGWYMT